MEDNSTIPGMYMGIEFHPIIPVENVSLSVLKRFVSASSDNVCNKPSYHMVSTKVARRTVRKGELTRIY